MYDFFAAVLAAGAIALAVYINKPVYVLPGATLLLLAGFRVAIACKNRHN